VLCTHEGDARVAIAHDGSRAIIVAHRGLPSTRTEAGRSAADEPIAEVEVPKVRPDQGHDSMRVSLAAGWRDDQAFVEQKNGAVVRRHVGYRRYTSAEAADLLTTLYDDLHAYVNFFQPMRKLLYKKRHGAKLYKR